MHQVLGSPSRTFRRSPFSCKDTEMYGDCFVSYDAENRCEHIEFFGSACVMFRGINLMELPCSQLRTVLGVVGVEFAAAESGFSSTKYGIGVYAPAEYEEPDCLPESVGVADSNYWANQASL